MSEKLIIDISGMTCSSCVYKVEKALKEVKGVSGVYVNFASEKAKINYDVNPPEKELILKAVSNAGFKASFKKEEKDKEAEIKEIKIKLIFGGLVSFVFLLAMAHMLGVSWLPMWLMNSYFQFALATPVLFWSGLQFHISAFKALKNKSGDMNTLVSLGTLSSYIYSSISTFYPSFFINNGLQPDLYFESAVIIIFLVMLGKYFEKIAKTKTNTAIKKLINLQPKTALVIDNDKEYQKNTSDVLVDEIILVKPGEKIPLDSIVIEGFSAVDESAITGESMPVSKKLDSKLTAGTINKSGALKAKVTHIEKDSLLAHIIQAVEDAQTTKAPIETFANKVTAYFVPTIIIISLITFISWWLLAGNFATAFLNAISVLVIACPCALGLATPTAIMVGTGIAAEKGILIRNSEGLEMTEKINVMIFDKTGTLTKGKANVTDIFCTDFEVKELVKITASMEKNSEHPLAEAIIEKSKELNLELKKTDYFNSFTGKGIEADIDNKTYFLGNKKLMDSQKITIHQDFLDKFENLAKEGKTVVYFSDEKIVLGIIAIADEVKENSLLVIQKLKSKNIEPVMISGDNKSTVAYVAKKLGIDKYYAEILPTEKAEYVKKFQIEGKKTAMVGDGINDSVALTQSDLGIAMGNGTDIAIDSSDIVIMNGDLNFLIEAFNLSHKTMKTIRQNLFWAFIYNALGVPIAAGVLIPFFGISLNPIISAMAMGLSSISVIGNSLKLRLTK